MNRLLHACVLLVAAGLAGCSNSPSADEHAKAASSQAESAGKAAGTAAKKAGAAVAEAAKSLDAGARPALHAAAPEVERAAKDAGVALKGAVASAGEGNAVRGEATYAQQCARCHGSRAQGGIGPRLTGERTRKSFAQTVAWIQNPRPPMPPLYPTPLGENDVKNVAAYVLSL
jgi:cytochrome c